MRPSPTLLLLALLPLSAQADCQADAALAVQVMNSYLQRIEQAPQADVTPWLRRHPLADASLAEAYAREQARGRGIDPQLGWGLDLLLDAQDYPDAGFELQHCGPLPGLLRLRGRDWPQFSLSVRLIDTPAGRRVAGAGRIAIEPAQRAPRGEY